ncbi:hypothetical protein FOA43_003943 [Brettanomyces nanus]|uniref:Uncharacterized protein n=1 Tax=Eeniella nana TaxID=13502 RepID=A0A875S6J8_EENNA|nr:uncharacterized protein FOA43_003943 [Brettanomyces nanus]QPG76553.1 hypothetical protein FOA43_003943 [Brettanomyces nanus]
MKVNAKSMPYLKPERIITKDKTGKIKVKVEAGEPIQSLVPNSDMIHVQNVLPSPPSSEPKQPNKSMKAVLSISSNDGSSTSNGIGDTAGDTTTSPDEDAGVAGESSTFFTMIPSLFRQWNMLSSSHASTPVPDARRSGMSQSRSDDGLLELYRLRVEPDTPFLSASIQQKHNIDRLAEWCIRIVADDYPQSATQVSVYSIEALVSAEKKWNPTIFSCFFLLPLHVRVRTAETLKVFSEFNKWIAECPNSVIRPDPNLFAGAMVVDAWTSLTRETPLQTDFACSNIFQKFSSTLDESAFAFQMTSVGRMLYEFLSFLSEGDRSSDQAAFWASARRKLLSFEYDMLIWPVKLSTELSVIDDDLQPSLEALVLHVLHNTLMIAYYGTAALRKGEYARNISLYSIPGLYLFISGMAKSNFITAPRIEEKWSIIAECQIVTARFLLALNREMPFDNLRESLHFHEKPILRKVSNSRGTGHFYRGR